MARKPGNELCGSGDLAGDPTDLRNQLGHGVLAGDRIIKDRRIDRATPLSGQHTRLGDDFGHRIENAVRTFAGRETTAPIRQHRGMETCLGHREPTCGFPAQIKRDRVRGLPVREVMDRLQHHHRRDHIGRNRGPATTRRKQVGKRIIGKQHMPMTGQETKHRTLGKKMPRERLDIQKLTLTIITTLHKSMTPTPISPAPQTRHYSAES